MGQRERPEDRRDRRVAAPGARDEEERDRGGDDQLARRGRRQRERRERAAVPGREAEERERRGEHGGPGRREPKTATPASKTTHARERREQRRLVAHDQLGIEPGEPRDEREEAVPERERIAGVEPAVLELVDGAQVQARQVDELAHARLVEQAVADDRALDVPEKQPSTMPKIQTGARGADSRPMLSPAARR